MADEHVRVRKEGEKTAVFSEGRKGQFFIAIFSCLQYNFYIDILRVKREIENSDEGNFLIVVI